MDCRRFHDLHLGFLDGSLADAELVAMQRHSTECTRCQRHDTAVRHGLLLFRNLPAIEPSADFSRRLDARLSYERHRQALTGTGSSSSTTTTRGPGLGAFAVAAAGVVAFGYLAAASFDLHRAPELRFEPVVASAPAEPLLPAANPTLVASGVSTGMPVWPAALLTQGGHGSMQVPATMFTMATWSR